VRGRFKLRAVRGPRALPAGGPIDFSITGPRETVKDRSPLVAY